MIQSFRLGADTALVVKFDTATDPFGRAAKREALKQAMLLGADPNTMEWYIAPAYEDTKKLLGAKWKTLPSSPEVTQ